MSSFTTQVRFICEVAAGRDESAGQSDVNHIITLAAPRVFNFDFPIYDEAYRPELEKKILRHFYTREIGYETVGLWKLKLEDKLNLIMPYYNKLYESTLLEFNPLYDVDYKVEGNKKGNKNSVNSGSRDETVESDKNVSGNESGNRNNIKSGDREENENRANTIKTTKENNDVESKNRDFVGTDKGSNTRKSTDNRSNTNTENSSGDRTLERDAWDLYSDTPQSGVIGLKNFGLGDVPAESVSNNAYLTNARRNTEESKEHTNNDNSGVSLEEGKIDEEGTNDVEYNYNTSDSNVRNKNENEDKQESGNASKKESNNTVEVGNDTREKAEHTTGKNTKYGTSTDVGNQDTTEDYAQHVFGKKGGYTYSKMIEEFRKTLINVDMQIMRELEPLFMGLWEL